MQKLGRKEAQMTTKIEWCEETWNPITGCTPISEGCAHCYAQRMAKRLAGRYGYPRDDPFRPGVFHPDQLNKPMEWKKPRRIFVVSMGDLFHEKVGLLDVIAVFDVIRMCPQHTFLLLTKRPARAFELLAGGTFLPNVWIGVTAENQQRADELVPILLDIPAAKRFVSVEPMLSAIDLTNYNPGYGMNNLNLLGGPGFVDGFGEVDKMPFDCLDWVILGGETGPGARPMHPDWARGVRDQCVAAGVPFFFKSFGAWADYYSQPGSDGPRWTPEAKALAALPTQYVTTEGRVDGVARFGSAKMAKVGKKTAGRLLDGREWNERPGT